MSREPIAVAVLLIASPSQLLCRRFHDTAF
jgi:hypothetical protein